MKPKEQLPFAIGLATAHHNLQTDKSGQPFIGHPLRVLGYVAMETHDIDVLCAAVMHDLIEDTSVTLQDLQGLSFSSKTRDLIFTLTRKPQETYADYINRIDTRSRGKLWEVKLIKRADLRDNLDIRRKFAGNDKLVERYKKALEVLGAGGQF